MSLVIYNKEKTNLSPISFINDLKNQTAIRSLDPNSNEFRKELGTLFTKINLLIGIKNEIDIFNKEDIKELILMRFKALSLNEIDYAFKLERYGKFGKRIEHYQLFNAQYVGEVLDKYLDWKTFQFKNVVKNIQNQGKTELSVNEKEIKNKKIVLGFLDRYEKNPYIEDDEFYIYDILDKKELMPTDVEYKKEVKKDAVTILQNEYSQRKAKSKDESRSFKRELEQVTLGKGGAVIRKCKVLVLEEFFRNLFKDQEKVIEFKEKFKSL